MSWLNSNFTELTSNNRGNGGGDLFIHDEKDIAYAVALLKGELQPTDNTIILLVLLCL
jgi:hypothetical protein